MKANKNDLWPVVRWAEKEQSWRVDSRTKDGGGVKFFPIRESSKAQALMHAKTYAEGQRIKRKNEGDSAFGFTATARIDATAALDIIAGVRLPMSRCASASTSGSSITPWLR